MRQAAGLLLLSALLVGCEAPARDKPWRRAPRPGAGQAADTPGGGAAAARAQKDAEAAAKRAHTLRIRLEVDPSHLNPLVDPDLDTLRVAEDTLFETLIRYEGAAGEGPGTYHPGLAQSWRISPDGREIRIQLRDDVEFHDGKSFGVMDAQFSIDAARSQAARAHRLRDALGSVMSCDLVSSREIRLTLRRPDAWVLRALAEVPMLPAHVYGEGELARPSRGRAPVGTGPYRLARWDRGERIVLARNETYWGTPPAIDEIEFVIEPDAARALVRAKQGELDVIPALIPEHYPDQANAMAEDFVIVRLRPARFQYVVLNTSRPPFDDVRVRRAATLVVDRRRLVEELRHGFAHAVAGPVWPGGPADGAAPAPPAFDPAAAAAVLEEAGWHDGDGDGIRERAGERLEIAVLVTNESRGDEERTLVLEGLRKVGFAIDPRPGEPAVLMNRLRSAEFDAALVDWRGRSDEDLAPLLRTNGPQNWGRFSSKAVDATLAALDQAWEPAARAPRAAELARLITEECPMVPLSAPDPVGLVHRRVKGLVLRDGWFSIRKLSLEAGR